MDGRRLRLPAATITAMSDRDDRAEYWELTTDEARIEWLDDRGLRWHWAMPLRSGTDGGLW